MSQGFNESFYFTVTDLFCGEPNYSWVSHYKVESTSMRGAITKLARYTGFRFRWDGLRYVTKSRCVCAYEMGDDGLTADELEHHYKFVTI